jgi:hypothetical protein
MMPDCWRQEGLFGALQTLAAATSLRNDRWNRQVQGGLADDFHMMFDAHQIVLA